MGGSSQRLTPRRIRRCVGCGDLLTKNTLLRVVRAPDGQVSLDPTGKAAGRGAYLCGRAACLAVAKKRNLLARALKQPVPKELYEQMEALCHEQGE